MRHGDNVQVAIKEFRSEAVTYNSMIIEFGALGQAVKLKAVHWHIDFATSTTNNYLAMALSSNPRHDLNPPGDQDLFFEDESLYGFGSFVYNQAAAGSDYARMVTFYSIIIPLYGLIRPRRQRIVWYHLASGIQIRLRAEIYYEAIELDRVTLETLDRKYGKYRRT